MHCAWKKEKKEMGDSTLPPPYIVSCKAPCPSALSALMKCLVWYGVTMCRKTCWLIPHLSSVPPSTHARQLANSELEGIV